MNTNLEENSYVYALVRKAFRRRSLIDLAAAFRAQKPNWGSQSALTALALVDYMTFIGWNHTTSQAAFPYWYEQAQEIMDPKVLPIRVSQIRELNTMLNEPRGLWLRHDPNAEIGEDRARAYALLANVGASYHELSLVANWLLYDLKEANLDEASRTLLEKELPRMQDLTPLQYVHALDVESRKWHPNTLQAASMEYFSQIGKVSSPYVGGRDPKGGTGSGIGFLPKDLTKESSLEA